MARAPKPDTDALTYKPAKKAKRPFRVGDQVEVIDRNHTVIGTQRIVKVGLQLVETECGRKWRIYDGSRWADKKAWPFPSIRHRTTPSGRAALQTDRSEANK